MESGKEREVSISEATEFARQENMDFFETSALTSYCVEPMFRRISLSIARVLPEVLVHLEVSYLPDGWMACVDDSPETEEAVTSSSDISLSDVAAALNEGPALAPSLTLSLSASSSSSYSSSPSIGNKRLSLASSVERTKSPLAAAAQRLKYINYWTGEVTRERPTYPAALSEGILHVARDTASADIDPFSGKPVERGLKERTSSCKTTATYVSSTSAASGSGGRSSSNEQQPNYDLHESRRSSMSKSSAEGGSSVTRCLRASCVIS